jgi:hypothetical protein
VTHLVETASPPEPMQEGYAFYRARAAEARLKAAAATDVRSREVFGEVAVCWERLADLEGSKPNDAPHE